MKLKRILLTLSLLVCVQSPIFAIDTCDSSFLNTGTPLNPEEVQQVTHMKNSILCQGNCIPTSEKLARYLITQDPEYIALPPMSERLKVVGRAFKNLGRSIVGATRGDSPIYESIDSFADIVDVNDRGSVEGHFNIGMDGIIKSLKKSGPGSHAIVHATYNNPRIPWGHAFNVINDSEGIKVIGSNNTKILKYQTWTPEFEESFLEKFKDDFTVIQFKPSPKL